jgi:hypothetical protein
VESRAEGYIFGKKRTKICSLKERRNCPRQKGGVKNKKKSVFKKKKGEGLASAFFLGLLL